MFGKRFNLITFAGFRIGVDISWFFIAILLTWTLAEGYFPAYYPNLPSQTYWLMGLLGMLGLFVSIILHELGHAVIARRFGMPISQITLFIFGGVAELKDEPPSPKAEFFVAIAGPIVSIVIAICMLLLTHVGLQLGWPVVLIGVTSYLAMINLVVVIFNLFPAFPLDGGRMLRAILWGWKNNLGWATKIATSLGSGFGFGLIFLGVLTLITGQIFVGLWWMIIGFFLHQAASSTRTQYFVKKELHGEKVEKFMTKNPISVPPDITVKELIDNYVYQSYHHVYPVVDDDKLIGYVSLKEVKTLNPEEWPKTTVRKIMIPTSQFQTVSPNTSALEALNLIHLSIPSTLLVVSDNRLVGILNAQDLFKLISLKLELEEEIRS